MTEAHGGVLRQEQTSRFAVKIQASIEIRGRDVRPPSTVGAGRTASPARDVRSAR
jgi:hypothetical protein